MRWPASSPSRFGGMSKRASFPPGPGWLNPQCQVLEQHRSRLSLPERPSDVRDGAAAFVASIGCRIAGKKCEPASLRDATRDRRAAARYGALTGSPDESGKKHRGKGLARSGNARVRRSMIQLAWRFLMFHKHSALAQWFDAAQKSAPTQLSDWSARPISMFRCWEAQRRSSSSPFSFAAR